MYRNSTAQGVFVEDDAMRKLYRIKIQYDYNPGKYHLTTEDMSSC